MSERSQLLAAIAVSLFGVLALAGCPNNPGAGCPEECARGMECDIRSATCVPSPLPVFERALPGRAVRLESNGARLWAVSVDPADGGIVATEFVDESERDARVLATPPRQAERRLAIAASARLLVVAWLAPSGLYEIAWRGLPGDNALWSFATVEPPSGDGYVGSNDFDLAVIGERTVALVFRDKNRTLRALVADGPNEEWGIELVDDGDVTDDGVACPDQLRRVEPAAGVGYEPSLGVRGTQLFVAYYDADCGDLRLGRRGDQRWSVTVVDTGEGAETSTERALTGRWPSVDFDAGGALGVAYHDVSGGRLMFALERDGRFQTEVVDEGFELDAFSRERKSLVGAFASLSLDDSGGVTIAYFDATSADVQLARRDGSSSEWSRQTLVADGAVGFSTDQVVDTEIGRFVAAERLKPTGSGLESELVLVEATQ